MKNVFPNLKQNFIEDMFFKGLIEGPIDEIRKYWKDKGFDTHIQKRAIVLFKSYSFDKFSHLAVLRVDLLGAKKALLHIDLTTKSNIKGKLLRLKGFSDQDFLDFFKWFLEKNSINLNRLAMLAHCRLPLNDELQYPLPIETKEEGPVHTTGVRFGFDEKTGIDTVIIEKTKNKDTPLYFMVETLPFFKLDPKLFNERFFDAPVTLTKNLVDIFCKKKMENKE
jgi:hypothetical protein